LSFLSAPKTPNLDPYVRNKFKLTWYTFIVYFTISIILTLIHSNNNIENFIISLSGLIFCSISILILYFTRTHTLVSKLTVIACTIAIQSAVYFLINPDRTVDVIWFYIFSLFAFYTINVKWGVFVLISNFIGLALYQPILNYVSDIKEFSQPIREVTLSDQIDYYINYCFGVLFMSYLLVKLINEHKITNEELKLKNKLVNEQNDEKTVMLKEIHHRVKNNLQIISSLLRLQSREIEDKKTIEKFEEATNRVVAMSLIHDKMYQSKNLSKIDLKDYLISLTQDLIKTYQVDTPIKVNIETEIQLITPKFLVSFALIFNELITNSLKHGFKTINQGQITIKIIKKNTNLLIQYNDNGKWLPPQKENSFGIELIETLTDQLDGEYQRDNKSGTTYNFIIPFESKNIN